ncbi:MAG: hypothetical protein NW206_10245 [Hyphomonadaceae bacterium]|nr:hypothetical protein [Hyphomonadaceae bacterium]
MPKTGTTSIQQSFAAAREELSTNGLLYPGKSVDHADLTPAFHQRGAGHYYYTNRDIAEAEAQAIGDAALADVQADISGFDGDIIFSTEYFFDLTPESVQRMRAFFEELGFRFRVILYIRHPVDAAISHSNQDIKMGFRTLKECVDNPNYHSNKASLEAFSKVLTREQLIVRDYEAVKDHDCVQDILEVCGYRGDRSAVPTLRSNVSLTMGGAILADAHARWKNLIPDFPNRRTYIFKVTGPKFSLPDETLDRVRIASAPEVEWVEKNFDIALKEGKRSGTYSSTLSDRAVLDIVAYISTLKQPPK